MVGGIDYSPGRRRDQLQARMVVATLDPAMGAEIARADLGMQGRPEQLRLAPDGTRMAVSCNALYTCDLPGGHQPHQSRVMLFDREGTRRWFAGIEHRHAPPDADGRAFDLGFSPSGNVVFAHVAFDAISGQVILPRQQPLPFPALQRLLQIATARRRLERPPSGVGAPGVPVPAPVPLRGAAGPRLTGRAAAIARIVNPPAAAAARPPAPRSAPGAARTALAGMPWRPRCRGRGG